MSHVHNNLIPVQSVRDEKAYDTIYVCIRIFIYFAYFVHFVCDNRLEYSNILILIYGEKRRSGSILPEVLEALRTDLSPAPKSWPSVSIGSIIHFYVFDVGLSRKV